eukprot:TRINITY_DN20816_c0_g3_i1.p1 TRINITY_DN20816_c0_g3~~TRINITY_DN20816_c0_g3_i1.p1  ORF type:complete len:586 (+),score=85.90 TRINITY_DN20816_c0_g3_i1:253-2010(+)
MAPPVAPEVSSMSLPLSRPLRVETSMAASMVLPEQDPYARALRQIDEDAEGGSGRNAMIHLLADSFDLGAFLVWGLWYMPHIADNDQPSFVLICFSVASWGGLLLIKGALEVLIASGSLRLEKEILLSLATRILFMFLAVGCILCSDFAEGTFYTAMELVYGTLPGSHLRYACLYVQAFLAVCVIAMYALEGLWLLIRRFEIQRRAYERDSVVSEYRVFQEKVHEAAASPKWQPPPVPMTTAQSLRRRAANSSHPGAARGVGFQAFVPFVVRTLQGLLRMLLYSHIFTSVGLALPGMQTASWDALAWLDSRSYPDPVRVMLCWWMLSLSLSGAVEILVRRSLETRQWTDTNDQWERKRVTVLLAPAFAEMLVVVAYDILILWFFRDVTNPIVAYLGVCMLMTVAVLLCLMLKSFFDDLPPTTKRIEDNLSKALAKHVYLEILYDVVQLMVQAWILTQVQFKEGQDHFVGKLFIDFLNLISTAIDLVLLKGAEAMLEADSIEGVAGLFRTAAKESLAKSRGDAQEKKAPSLPPPAAEQANKSFTSEQIMEALKLLQSMQQGTPSPPLPQPYGRQTPAPNGEPALLP